ncbi:MAG: AMP-binding protein [Planctomycetes bacterium]|nr:AMP-binding protein [Planctomycetota bacterium]
MMERVLASNPFYAKKFSGMAFDAETSNVQSLPFTTRQEIQQDQQDHPPYGTNLTYPIDRYVRQHQTSGTSGRPLRWLDSADDWAWFRHCWGIIYRAADVGPQDRFIFPFSFGPFIGFWAAFESAVAMGNLCLPAGGMTTSARLRYLMENEVTVVACTPTYALRMAEVATDDGIDLAGSSVRMLIVAGEPGGNVPSTRARIESAWGARVFDHAGMTEIGPWGFECVEAPGGMHVIESEFIAELIDPDGDQPVPDGEIGELVLTNLGRLGSPLIRYRTGDQVRLTRGPCACGRSFARVEGGILGRSDDMVIIRGNNVFPSAIEGILHGFDEVAEFRVEVDQGASVTELRIEVEPGSSQGADRLGQRIDRALRDRLHFRPVVRMVAPGTLPRFEMKAQRWTVRGR